MSYHGLEPVCWREGSFTSRYPVAVQLGVVTGSTISHYKILSEVGRGGMGVVYKAEDTKLKRLVALKFLRSDVLEDEEHKERFLREAQAAAALDHPNICTVYEIDEVDGQTFLSMAYLEGDTVKEKIKSRPLKLEEALDIAVQTAQGLQAAHEKGIVHRDIKSANLMVTPQGQVKIMDFGLAQLAERSQLTKTATILGTPAYMSPEQARRQRTDRRTDIWSLGVVIYEMLTGRLPFEGERDQAVLYAITTEEPEPITGLRVGVPVELDRIVGKALAKKPEERYQHVEEMIVDLRALGKQGSIDADRPSPGRARASRRKSAYVYGGIAALILTVVIAVAAFLASPGEETIDSLAVLPFVNASGDPEADYLSDGLAESIINSLSPLPDLKVMSFSSVTSFRGEKANPGEAGRVLDVKAVLMGRVAQRGNSLFISAELVDARDNSQIWGAQYNRRPDDVFAIQEEIGREISEKLRLRLTGEQKAGLAKQYTDNAEAYRDYLRGRFFWNKRTADDLKTAVDYFQKAVGKDPTFAPGYAGLAQSYGLMYNYGAAAASDAYPLAERAALKALEIDGSLSEGHMALALVKANYQRDWGGAERGFQIALELNSGNATAHMWYAVYLLGLGRFDEALTEMRRAEELDPLSLANSTVTGQTLYLQRRYDEAIDQLQETLKLDPDFGLARLALGYAYIQKSMYREAVTELQKAQGLWGDHPRVICALGLAHALSGNRVAAERLLEVLKQASLDAAFQPFAMATIYVGLGQRGLALQWLEKEFEQPGLDQMWFAANPVFDPLRSDPRFDDLLERMNLEPSVYQQAFIPENE